MTTATNHSDENISCACTDCLTYGAEDTGRVEE